MNETIEPSFVEALNTQPDAAANPVLQAILAAIDPILSGQESLPLIQNLLSQLGSTEPILGLLAKYLLAQQESVKYEGLAIGVEAEQYLPRDGSARLPQIVEHLQNQIRNLHAELEYLWERNDMLARALGACYLCWGEDSDCRVCGGTGHPGSMLPEKRIFSRLIMPAIHAIHAPKEVHASDSNNHQVTH